MAGTGWVAASDISVWKMMKVGDRILKHGILARRKGKERVDKGLTLV